MVLELATPWKCKMAVKRKTSCVIFFTRNDPKNLEMREKLLEASLKFDDVICFEFPWNEYRSVSHLIKEYQIDTIFWFSNGKIVESVNKNNLDKIEEMMEKVRNDCYRPANIRGYVQIQMANIRRNTLHKLGDASCLPPISAESTLPFTKNCRNKKELTKRGENLPSPVLPSRLGNSIRFTQEEIKYSNQTTPHRIPSLPRGIIPYSTGQESTNSQGIVKAAIKQKIPPHTNYYLPLQDPQNTCSSRPATRVAQSMNVLSKSISNQPYLHKPGNAVTHNRSLISPPINTHGRSTQTSGNLTSGMISTNQPRVPRSRQRRRSVTHKVTSQTSSLVDTSAENSDRYHPYSSGNRRQIQTINPQIQSRQMPYSINTSGSIQTTSISSGYGTIPQRRSPPIVGNTGQVIGQGNVKNPSIMRTSNISGMVRTTPQRLSTASGSKISDNTYSIKNNFCTGSSGDHQEDGGTFTQRPSCMFQNTSLYQPPYESNTPSGTIDHRSLQTASTSTLSSCMYGNTRPFSTSGNPDSSIRMNFPSSENRNILQKPQCMYQTPSNITQGVISPSSGFTQNQHLYSNIYQGSQQDLESFTQENIPSTSMSYGRQDSSDIPIHQHSSYMEYGNVYQQQLSSCIPGITGIQTPYNSSATAEINLTPASVRQHSSLQDFPFDIINSHTSTQPSDDPNKPSTSLEGYFDLEVQDSDCQDFSFIPNIYYPQ